MKKSFWKHLIIASTILLSTAVLTACSSSSKDSSSKSGSASAAKVTDEDKKGPITIWTSSNVMKESAEKWAKKAGKTVKVVVVPTVDFDKKLKQQVNDPSTAPDVFIVSRDFVKDWAARTSVTVNYSETFKSDAAKYKKNTFNDVYQLGLDPKGNLVGMTGEEPIGMMFYNRKIAKDILGTDDPAEVAKSLNTLDKWKTVNNKLKAKYDGKTKLFGNTVDSTNLLFAQRKTPYVKNNTFTITKDMAKIFDTTKTWYQDKMFVSQAEDEAYQAGYNSNTFFVSFLPTWGFSSKLVPQITDKSGAGNWGVTQPTMSYARGGSYFFMTKTSKHKKSAWNYIKSQTVNTDNLYNDQKSKVGYPSSKLAAKKLVDSGYKEPLLGEQKVYDMYAKQQKVQDAAYKDIVTKYDSTVSGFMGDLIKDYGAGNITKEQALKKLGDEVKGAYPELTVKNAYK
ncbi:extracellular solute-binding protein [Lapidilactobacillus bayanensis]|uniref:extracellular solute-binding protein n=1 Tax=Lapidilactobacillus bayanensis TaxID=2485998 RepID=UPI000F7990EC|nr:extracellular solute-binding protein [Lapidilactobacillus bayanensis]